MKSALSGLTALLATAVPFASAEAATPITLETEYHIAIAGLPIARAVFNTRLDDRNYTISGQVNTSGLADLIANIDARTSVTGTVSGNVLRAKNYNLIYSSGKKTSVYRVNYNQGRVTSTSIAPEPKRPPEWVPVNPRQLASVLDPISGLVFPEGRKVCPRSLPIYDGETRMDLVLGKKGTRPFSADGYKGEALVCSVRFVPKGGYKQGRKDIEYLKKTSQMEIWFASAGKLKLVAPVFVRIPTQVGMLTISAKKISN